MGVEFCRNNFGFSAWILDVWSYEQKSYFLTREQHSYFAGIGSLVTVIEQLG